MKMYIIFLLVFLSSLSTAYSQVSFCVSTNYSSHTKDILHYQNYDVTKGYGFSVAAEMNIHKKLNALVTVSYFFMEEEKFSYSYRTFVDPGGDVEGTTSLSYIPIMVGVKGITDVGIFFSAETGYTYFIRHYVQTSENYLGTIHSDGKITETYICFAIGSGYKYDLTKNIGIAAHIKLHHVPDLTSYFDTGIGVEITL